MFIQLEKLNRPGCHPTGIWARTPGPWEEKKKTAPIRWSQISGNSWKPGGRKFPEIRGIRAVANFRKSVETGRSQISGNS